MAFVLWDPVDPMTSLQSPAVSLPSKFKQSVSNERADVQISFQLEFHPLVDIKAAFLGFNTTSFSLFMDWFGMLMEAQWQRQQCGRKMDDKMAAVRFLPDRSGSLSTSFSRV